MKRYRVESTRTLLHDGRRYEGGEIVELEDAAARPLLDLGAIFEYDSEPDQTPEVEAEVEHEKPPRRRGRPRRQP